MGTQIAHDHGSRRNAIGPRVLDALLANGVAELTFAELASLAGASRRSMTAVAKALEPVAIIRRDPLRFGSGAGLVLSFEVGFEDIRGALVDANGTPFAAGLAKPDPSQLAGPPRLLLSRLRTLALQILEAGFREAELTDANGCLPLLGATVAWPTAVGRDGYAHGHAFEDKEWHAVPLNRRIGVTLGGPFEDLSRVDGINAANAAVLAIAFDLTRSRTGGPIGEHSEIAMVVRLQGGISAGTMHIAPHRPGDPLAFVASRLIVGTNGFAGELGHLPVSASVIDNVNADRPKGLAPVMDWECSCRQRGHLEGLASARALMRRLSESNYDLVLDDPNGPQVTRLLDKPDEVLWRALHDTGRLIGRALASPILMLDPASITLTGYLAREAVVAGVTREQHTWSTGVSNSVKIGYLDGNANDLVEVRGAALAMFRRRLYSNMHKICNSAQREQLIFTLSPDLHHVETFRETQ
jgi:hypothetical protein